MNFGGNTQLAGRLWNHWMLSLGIHRLINFGGNTLLTWLQYSWLGFICYHTTSHIWSGRRRSCCCTYKLDWQLWRSLGWSSTRPAQQPHTGTCCCQPRCPWLPKWSLSKRKCLPFFSSFCRSLICVWWLGSANQKHSLLFHRSQWGHHTGDILVSGHVAQCQWLPGTRMLIIISSSSRSGGGK